MAESKKKWFGLAALGAVLAGIVTRMRRRGAGKDTDPPEESFPGDSP